MVRIMLIEQIYRALEIKKNRITSKVMRYMKKILLCILDGWGIGKKINIMLFILLKL